MEQHLRFLVDQTPLPPPENVLEMGSDMGKNVVTNGKNDEIIEEEEGSMGNNEATAQSGAKTDDSTPGTTTMELDLSWDDIEKSEG